MSHCNVTISDVVDYNTFWSNNNNYLQVILFEIDCAIFYTNLHELFCQIISWTNWINSGKFLDNCWISCQVVADMKKVYDDLIIINLYQILFNTIVEDFEGTIEFFELVFLFRFPAKIFLLKLACKISL